MIIITIIIIIIVMITIVTMILIILMITLRGDYLGNIRFIHTRDATITVYLHRRRRLDA
jgi:hypothetical protein